MTDVEHTREQIAHCRAQLATTRGGERRFYEIALAGWERHLAFAMEEAKRHRDDQDEQR